MGGAMPESTLEQWMDKLVPHHLARRQYDELKAENERLRGIVEKKQHDGDCTIYASLDNGRCTDGVCTCGFGKQRARHCDWSKMYSEEREAAEAAKEDKG